MMFCRKMMKKDLLPVNERKVHNFLDQLYLCTSGKVAREQVLMKDFSSLNQSVLVGIKH